MIDIKKFLYFNRVTIGIIILVLCLGVPFAYSKFFSGASSDNEIDTAFYILTADYYNMEVHMDNLVPRNQYYTYNFSVANNDGSKRAETSLIYSLKIVTTTNLPLTYYLYKNENYYDSGSTNIITDDVIARDGEEEDSTYFRTLSTDDVTFGYEDDEQNDYQLVISFPSTYDSIDYQDIVEGINIIIESQQVIEEDGEGE